MNWQEILIILVPILSLMAWTYGRIDKKFENMDKKFDRKFENVDKKFDKIEDNFREVKQMLHSLDMRLTKLEGRFEERGYWESRKTGTHDE